jgi:hypothetical protein
MRRIPRRDGGMTNSTVRGKYQPALAFPSCSSQGQTCAGAAATVNARFIVTPPSPTTSSPGRGARRSAAVAFTFMAVHIDS